MVLNIETIEKAEKLVGNIDFKKFIRIIKKQPLRGYTGLKRKDLDIKVIYAEKKRWDNHFKTQLNNLINYSPDKFHEIKRELSQIAKTIIEGELTQIAKTIVEREKSILNIKNRGWFFNYKLLGEIWANGDALKNYKKALKTRTKP